eukprot:1988846-Amphidinium_carterae.1
MRRNSLAKEGLNSCKGKYKGVSAPANAGRQWGCGQPSSKLQNQATAFLRDVGIALDTTVHVGEQAPQQPTPAPAAEEARAQHQRRHQQQPQHQRRYQQQPKFTTSDLSGFDCTVTPCDLSIKLLLGH